MENLDIQKYIDNINKYHNQFTVLQNLSSYDKIAIGENDILYLQKKTPWRYIIRKIKKQNRDRLTNYLTTNINDYIKNIDNIINIYENSKDNNIKKILENVIMFITSILGGIISLRNYYNLKPNSNNISMILESTNNRLNTIIIKIKLIV
jgi:hypothetical protein